MSGVMSPPEGCVYRPVMAPAGPAPRHSGNTFRNLLWAYAALLSVLLVALQDG